MKKLVIATAIAAVLATPAFADTVSFLGPNPTSGAGAFANTNPGTGGGGSGAFVDIYNFSLTTDQTLTIAFAVNTYADGASQFITGFQGSVIYEGPDGVIGGGDDQVVLGPAFAVACALVPNCQGFGGSATLNAGEYHLRIAGDAAANAGYGGNLSTSPIPLPGAAWLFLSGIAGLGLLARRRKQSAA